MVDRPLAGWPGLIDCDEMVGICGLIVVRRSQIFRVGEFPCQLSGIVDQNRKVLSADPEFSLLVAEHYQGNLAIVSSALDAGGGLFFSHISSTNNSCG